MSITKTIGAALSLLLLGLPALPAAAGEPVEKNFALVIGYNGQPPGTTDESIQPLRYADDDALAFFALQKELGADAVLLTVADAETRRRYPLTADSARPPTMDEISRNIDALNARMDVASRQGMVPVLTLFYSGHGARDPKGEAALALLDGTLSQSAMHQRVLDKIRSQVVHLIIDACHAEPWSGRATSRQRRSRSGPRIWSSTFRARAPPATRTSGFVIASSSGASTHEWDLYQSGVFTHEVISDCAASPT
jgi:hypothetical protein